MQNKTPIVVALSGGGRTLENLFLKAENHSYEIVGVISSNPGCKGVLLAHKLGLDVWSGYFASPIDEDLEKSLYGWLKFKKPLWIVLGGFLKKFPVFPEWEFRTINIHPALLPKFGGKGMYGQRVHRAVKEAGEKTSGATVHFVNDCYDEGQIIAQVEVPLANTDSVDRIASKVFRSEQDLYPKVIDLLLTGKLPLADGSIFNYILTDGD